MAETKRFIRNNKQTNKQSSPKINNLEVNRKIIDTANGMKRGGLTIYNNPGFYGESESTGKCTF